MSPKSNKSSSDSSISIPSSLSSLNSNKKDQQKQQQQNQPNNESDCYEMELDDDLANYTDSNIQMAKSNQIQTNPIKHNFIENNQNDSIKQQTIDQYQINVISHKDQDVRRMETTESRVYHKDSLLPNDTHKIDKLIAENIKLKQQLANYKNNTKIDEEDHNQQQQMLYLEKELVHQTQKNKRQKQIIAQLKKQFDIIKKRYEQDQRMLDLDYVKSLQKRVDQIQVENQSQDQKYYQKHVNLVYATLMNYSQQYEMFQKYNVKLNSEHYNRVGLVVQHEQPILDLKTFKFGNDYYVLSVGLDQRLKIFDIFHQKTQFTIDNYERDSMNLQNKHERIRSCEFMYSINNEGYLATGGHDCYLKIWKMNIGQWIQTQTQEYHCQQDQSHRHCQMLRSIYTDSGSVNQLLFKKQADQNMLLTRHKKCIKVWNSDILCKPIQIYKGTNEYEPPLITWMDLNNHYSNCKSSLLVYSCARSSQTQKSQNNDIQLMDIERGQMVQFYKGCHDRYIRRVKFMQNNMNLLCSMDQDQLKYWDLRKNNKVNNSTNICKPILQTRVNTKNDDNVSMVDFCEMNGLVHTVMSNSSVKFWEFNRSVGQVEIEGNVYEGTKSVGIDEIRYIAVSTESQRGLMNQLIQ